MHCRARGGGRVLGRHSADPRADLVTVSLSADPRIRDDVSEPAVLLTHVVLAPGVVQAWNSIGTCTRLLAALGPGRAMLVRLVDDAGREFDDPRSQSVHMIADVFAITLWQPGGLVFPPKGGGKPGGERSRRPRTPRIAADAASQAGRNRVDVRRVEFGLAPVRNVSREPIFMSFLDSKSHWI